jgi:hypothetical protein
MAELQSPPPIQIEQPTDPNAMSIVQIRRHASSLGHAGVWKMKKADILALLSGQAPSPSQPINIPKPTLQRQTNHVEEKQIEPLPSMNKPRLNVKLLKADVVKGVRACENPQTLLSIFSMLQL